MMKRDETSMDFRALAREPSRLRSVRMPIAHQGIMDALRRAYEEPIGEPADEFDRLLARLQ